MPFPLDEKYILKTEVDLRVRFPDSFREKMMNDNGGSIKIDKDYFELHPFYDTSDKKRIKRTCNSISHETKIARKNYSLSINLVVIGHNGSGDDLVYKVNALGNIGKQVFLLDHETNDLRVVAEDFDELV